jgi:hypothetical protein
LVVGNFTDSRPCWCCAEEKRVASPTSLMNVIIPRRVSRFGDSRPCWCCAEEKRVASPTRLMNVIIPRRVSRFGDSALTSFILHSLLHLPCLTFSFTYLLLPTESPRRETLRRRRGYLLFEFISLVGEPTRYCSRATPTRAEGGVGELTRNTNKGEVHLEGDACAREG